MRILAAHHLSGKTFLHDLDQTPPMRLFCTTRVEARGGDELVVEVRFPELPSRVLVRARIAGRERGGVWLAFTAEDRPTLDFLVAAAMGQNGARGAAMRKSTRLPVRMPVQVEAAGRPPLPGDTEDLSAGGAFVRTSAALPVGAAVTVHIPTALDETISMPGVVQWSGGNGLGIRFQAAPALPARRLRAFLRRMHDRGTLV